MLYIYSPDLQENKIHPRPGATTSIQKQLFKKAIKENVHMELIITYSELSDMLILGL